MKIRSFFAAASLAAAMALAGPGSALAEVVTGKVVAITKNAKSSTIEIAPSTTTGKPASHRYSATTTFQEIVHLLEDAIPTNAIVIISTSTPCATSGVLRDCGSILSVESIRTM